MKNVLTTRNVQAFNYEDEFQREKRQARKAEKEFRQMRQSGRGRHWSAAE